MNKPTFLYTFSYCSFIHVNYLKCLQCKSELSFEYHLTPYEIPPVMCYSCENLIYPNVKIIEYYE